VIGQSVNQSTGQLVNWSTGVVLRKVVPLRALQKVMPVIPA
jgi:hypothetical protein